MQEGETEWNLPAPSSSFPLDASIFLPDSEFQNSFLRQLLLVQVFQCRYEFLRFPTLPSFLCHSGRGPSNIQLFACFSIQNKARNFQVCLQLRTLSPVPTWNESEANFKMKWDFPSSLPNIVLAHSRAGKKKKSLLFYRVLKLFWMHSCIYSSIYQVLLTWSYR